MRGTVKFFNFKKGWGFVAGADNVDYFLSYDDKIKGLKKGTRVSFDVHPKWDNPRAINIKNIEDDSSKEEEIVSSLNTDFPKCERCGDAIDVVRLKDRKGGGVSSLHDHFRHYWCEICEHSMDDTGQCMTEDCRVCNYNPNKGRQESRTGPSGGGGSGWDDPTPLTPPIAPRCINEECNSTTLRVSRGGLECSQCGDWQP